MPATSVSSNMTHSAVVRGGVNVRRGLKLVLDATNPANDTPDIETAFAAAYETEFPRAYGYIRYRVGRADAADDLVSQTFLKALDRLSTFDPSKGRMGPWLLGIARNVVRDYRRAQWRWGWLPLDRLRDRASVGPNPEQGAMDAQRRQQVLRAVSGLRDRERDVLGLKFAGGLTNRAIAQLTGLGESHVGVIVYRAVGRLRTQLTGRDVRRG